ncbi:MAG: ShlB/FhaC/HecB family hemolysin secretion/activation protein [Cyanobacteria bacterium P01_A01_bin.135]
MSAYVPLLALVTVTSPSGDTLLPEVASYPTPGRPAVELAQQPNPNEERFLQETPDTPSVEDETPVLPEIPASSPALPTEGATVPFRVEQVVVEGSTVFSPAELRPLVEPLAGTTVTLADLQAAADEITQLYLSAGYLTSRAIVPEQTVVDGLVRLQVIEGQISAVVIEGTRRLRQAYVRDRVELGLGIPLRTDRLENQLRLLRADPLIDSISARLQAGEESGESRLVVQVAEADPWAGELRVDNYSPPSVGSERIGGELAYRNLTGLGDALSVSVDRTAQGGSTLVEAGYRVPLNPMDGTLQVRALVNRNQIITPSLEAFDIEGESELYEVSFRQPLVRSPRQELALSVGFGYRDGQTLINQLPVGAPFDPDITSRTSVFRFGQDYTRRDRLGAWALRSQFSLGTGLFNATVTEDGPDSRFFSWLGQAQRAQRLGRNQVLVAQLDLQLTPDPLLASEDFVIGGGRSLRGFRQNARAGDNGVRFSLEDRITLARDEAGAATVQLLPFADLGAVWNDGDGGELPDQQFLAGVGVGALWEMLPDLTLRVDLAVPLVDLDDRGENAQDDGIYFSVNYRL